jgi:hypothetical protein
MENEWDIDLILFSHLIPCCQHYIPGEKLAFETTVNDLASSFGDKKAFVSFLFGHPKNSYLKNYCHEQGYSCEIISIVHSLVAIILALNRTLLSLGK